MGKKYKAKKVKKSSSVTGNSNINFDNSSVGTHRRVATTSSLSDYLDYSDYSDYSDKPKPPKPPKLPKQPPPQTPPTWFWHGFQHRKATNCDSNGKLVFGLNCSEIDATVGHLSSPVFQLPLNIPNLQYPYTTTQAATTNYNGYQLPWGIFGASYNQPNIVGAPPTGYGHDNTWCCSVPGPFLVQIPHNQAQWGNGNARVVFKFHLQDAFFNFLPQDPLGVNGCHNGEPPYGPNWSCTNLGNNHFQWEYNIHSMNRGIRGDVSHHFAYVKLKQGSYTFTIDELIFNDGTGDVIQTVNNPSATFIVEADPPCGGCLDPTLAFNQMPFAYRESWAHWHWITYSPPLTFTGPQYLWLVDFYNTQSLVAIPPGSSNMVPWGNYPLMEFAQPTNSIATFSGGYHPVSGKSNLPIAYNVQNPGVNGLYPNQSAFCEHCRDWQNADPLGVGIPNTWGAPPPIAGQVGHPWQNYIVGGGVGLVGLQWLPLGPQTPYPVNLAAQTTYTTNEPFTLLVDAEAACDCCPKDTQGFYTSIGLDPGFYFHPVPPTGTWMGPPW